ncbi:hypothetical protein [Microbacterium azadirachtae]|uniref:hypothetical protein n=1 Tax=Microbacterium azadirachtae TaxID=582680 RepID=UPI003F74C55A
MQRVDPVSAYPPASSRTIEQWLDPELGSRYSAEFGTRLREIADARAGVTAMWAAFLSLGLSAVLFALVMLAVTARVDATVPWMIAGAAVAAVSVLFLRRVRRWMPRPGRSVANRGPGDLRGGLWAAAAIFVALNVLFAISVLTTGDIGPILLVDLGIVLLLASAFVVPPAIIGRSREMLRRQAAKDPRLLATLERERLTWTPRPGTPMFGPL